MDPDRIDRLSRIAVRHMRRSSPVYDDLLSEARIAVWQHHHRDDAFCIWVGRARAIDWLRAWHRQSRPGTAPDLVPLDGVDVSTVDPVDPVAELGLAGRHAVIAQGLVDGDRKQDIAARLGVSPARVSQLITELRKVAD